MKYKKKYIFLPNLSGSSYLSPVLEFQGGTGRVAAAGRESLCPWDRITSTKGSLYPSLWQNFHQWPEISPENEVVWGEPRPEFNMDFNCHGKVIVILTYTKLGFINLLKAQEAAAPALVGLFCLLLFNLFYYFIYWCSESSGNRGTSVLWGGRAVSMRLSCWMARVVQDEKSWCPQSMLKKKIIIANVMQVTNFGAPCD